MTRELRCADLIPGCDFVAHGTHDSDVMKKAAEHAKRAHRMIAIGMEVEKRRERRSGMSWASWRPGAKSFEGGSFNSEPGAKMRENKTRLLLILSQDMLDQARVIAGRATTVLKLPVSLQIVFPALIGGGMDSAKHTPC